jgi:hypothetical protein
MTLNLNLKENSFIEKVSKQWQSTKIYNIPVCNLWQCFYNCNFYIYFLPTIKTKSHKLTLCWLIEKLHLFVPSTWCCSKSKPRRLRQTGHVASMKEQEIQKAFLVVNLKKTNLSKHLWKVNTIPVPKASHKDGFEHVDIMFYKVWIRKWMDISGQLQASTTTVPAKRDLGDY